MSPVYIEAKAKEVNLPNAVRVDNLERWTGADFIISTLKMPMKTFPLLMKHVDSGCLLIQYKQGEDLAASVGDRLNNSIARMREVTRRTAQHYLLFVGTLGCDHEGSAQINGHRTHRNVSWVTIDGAIVGWLARGGVYYNLPREGLLAPWVQFMERRLDEYAAHQYKLVYNTKDYPDDLPSIQDDSLQLPVRVRDARVTLLSLPGLGVELVERVWAWCGPSLKVCLSFLTDVNNAGRVEGIGKAKIERIREYFALDAGEALWIRSDVEDISAHAVAEMRSMTPAQRKRTVERDTDELFGRKGNKVKA